MIECQDEKCQEEQTETGGELHKLLLNNGFVLFARVGYSAMYNFLPRGAREVGKLFHYAAGHRVSNVYVSKNLASITKCTPNSRLAMTCVV